MKSSAPRLSRYALFGLVAVAIWLVSIDLPDAPTDGLDASWQQAIVDAHEHGRSFGNGVIFSAGPLGFLTCHFYLPGLVDTKLAWEFAGKLLLAIVFVVLAAPLPPARRLLFFSSTLLFACLFPDTLFTVLLALVVLHWLLPPDTSNWRIVGALVLLAFLAQLKFTYCLLAAAAVGLAILARLVKRDLRGALATGAAFIAAFLLFWLAAGQNPIRLPDYLRYSWQISVGYPGAMGIDETWPVFLTGAAIALLDAAYAWQRWRSAPIGRRLAAASVALFLTALWFLAWKHGFTRADDHVLGFFFVCLIISFALPDLTGSPLRRWWLPVIASISVFGAWLATPDLIQQSPHILLDRLGTNAGAVLHPDGVRSAFAAGFARERAAHDLPALRTAVGTATVDLLNYEQGLLALNGLSYSPRPVPQSYSVYTPSLMQKNAGFFAGPRAPQFVVVRFGSIDGRYPTQDDALVLAELPLLYDTVHVGIDYVLWRQKLRTGSPFTGLAREPLANWSGAFGTEITLPVERSHAIWVRLDCTPSWIGRLRALSYKPAQLVLVVTESNDRETRHRLVPAVAAEGFLLQPFLETPEDYAVFACGSGGKWIRSIRVEPAAEDERELWAGLAVNFDRLPQLPLTPDDDGHALRDAGFANLSSTRMKSEVTVQLITVEGHNAVIVHAPGELEFAPPRDRHRLHGRFGIAEGAYTGAGDTDGAEFSIEITHADHRVETIWHRLLAPKTVPTDRGLQDLNIALPADTTRVLLRTGPGPSGRHDWDWTFWTQLEFSR